MSVMRWFLATFSVCNGFAALTFSNMFPFGSLSHRFGCQVQFGFSSGSWPNDSRLFRMLTACKSLLQESSASFLSASRAAWRFISTQALFSWQIYHVYPLLAQLTKLLNRQLTFYLNNVWVAKVIKLHIHHKALLITLNYQSVCLHLPRLTSRLKLITLQINTFTTTIIALQLHHDPNRVSNPNIITPHCLFF